MYRIELPYFIALTVIILFSHFLPADLLILLDNIFIRIGIVGILLYLISKGPTAGIFGLLAISILFLERNRRKVSIAVKKIDLMDFNTAKYATVEEATQPQQTVPVSKFNTPDNNEYEFLPQDTYMSDNFEPVAPSINQKSVLSTIYPLNKYDPESGTAAKELYESMGFGHIQGVKTINNNLE